MERLKTFTNRNEAIKALASHIIQLIEEKQEIQNDSYILLSGGSTPLPLYKLLAESSIDFSKLTFGLVDERFVPVNAPQSNEGMIREIFQNQPSFQCIGMVTNDQNIKESIENCQSTYPKFIGADLVILGMGSDGHFASLFPNDEASLEGLKGTNPQVLATYAPVYPNHRISCNLALLKTIKNRILLITGEEKLNKLKLCSEEGSPISYIFDSLTDIYYAP